MKAGDLVSVNGNPDYPDHGQIGLVHWVNEVYPPSCGVMMNGKMEIYDTRNLQVISESR